MNISGLLIYHKNFKGTTEDFKDTLISGEFTKIKLFLETCINKKGTSIIEEKDQVVFIIPGELINGVIICNEKMMFIKQMFENLMKNIEKIYQHVLINWNHDLAVFKPIDNMVNDLFSLRK